MVTVVKTPQGHKIIDQAISATIVEGSGLAVVTFPYHSLSTGDYIYLTSDIDEYNGFWFVDVVNADTFLIKEHEHADPVEFYQEVDIEYYQTQTHEWASIFLPIVYKITNNQWPTNTRDTARTVSSQADDNGFTVLNLSGELRAEGVSMLEFVRISGAVNSDLNNIWQIVEVIDSDSVVVNIPYSVNNSFSGALVQYYYNNYQVRVKVWAGLEDTHPWADKKPYEEMAELSLTPDENNEVMFSVSDYIKSKVAIKNNLTLFSLPLNLDAFTGYYIQTAESYDESDNYSLVTNETLFVDDSFEGYAIAGKLPFKNTYSGDYADYVYTSGSPAQWLTNAERLLAVEGLYFDISFIKNVLGPIDLVIKKYLSDDYFLTETSVFEDQGIGVYRIPLTIDAAYEAYCLSAATQEHEEEVPPEALDLSTMQNGTTGAEQWTLGPQPYAVPFPGTETLWVSKVTLNGGTLKVNYRVTVTDYPAIVYFGIASSPNSLGDDQNTGVISGVNEGTINLTATTDRSYFTIYAEGGLATVMINSISFGDPSTVMVPGETVTEEICIDILETCEAQQGFTEEDRRLLEDGDYRLLE